MADEGHRMDTAALPVEQSGLEVRARGEVAEDRRAGRGGGPVSVANGQTSGLGDLPPEDAPFFPLLRGAGERGDPP